MTGDLKKKINVCLGILILIITCMSLVVIKNDSPWRAIDLPTDNFVKLILKTTSIIDCQDVTEEELETFGYECLISPYGQIEIGIGEGQASGMAFITKDDITYILTADHFCSSSDNIQENLYWMTIDSSLEVIDIHGNIWNADIVYTDPMSDICLLKSNMPEVETISLASKSPKIGDKIYNLAAPLGISGEDMVPTLTGIFSGCDEDGYCYQTIPATNGSSGSIILNAKGEMIGMIQMTAIRANFISIGPSRDMLHIFLLDASRDIDVNLLGHDFYLDIQKFIEKNTQ